MRILTEDTVKGIVEETLHTLDRIGKGYKKGFLSETDCFHMMLSEVYDGFWCFLREREIEIRIDCGNYDAFTKEYLAYLEKSPSPVHIAWIFERKSGRELSEEDRKLVFYLMSQYCLSPEYFEPAPKGIVRPERSFAHGWHDSTAYGVHFKCIDDGGLIASDDPVGKTYTLVSDKGLRAVLKIKEDRRHGGAMGLDFDERVSGTSGGVIACLAQFLGEGYIEGYTSKERTGTPDILVRLDGKGEINWLAYYSYPDDELAYETFPLWQEYFLWSSEKAARDRAVLSALFVKYINQMETEEGLV